MTKHPAFRYTLAILFAIGALYLAFHKQNFHELGKQLEDANLAIIIAGTLVMFTSHLVRAWRYKMFLRPIAPKTRLSSAFRALLAGYGMNNIIPRSGDIVRPVLFSKRENIPVASSVAVLLIERLTDLIGLSAILIFSLIFFREQIALEFPAVAAITWPLVGILLAILCLALVILFSEKKTASLISFVQKKLPEKFRAPIAQAAISIEQGLHGVRTGSAIPVILGTLGISALYTASMYVSTFAFPNAQLHRIGFVGCFLLQTMSGLAFTIPTPGGTGTYHFFISQALTAVFGVPPEVGIAFATLTHASNYILTTVVGLGFMFADGISISTVRSDEAKAEVAMAKKRTSETGGRPTGFDGKAQRVVSPL